MDLWGQMFYLRPQTVGGEMVACGVAAVYLRPAGGFPWLPLIESAKKWQRSFFYVTGSTCFSSTTLRRL